MADSAVEITAGTGTNVDTRTEGTNGHHRQVVVLGDPATNAGVAPVDATNGLSVNVTNASLTVASHAVTNAGTFAVQVDGSALTALQKIDDPVLVDDAAFTPGTSSVMMAGAQFDNSGTDSVDEGDAGALRMSANRNLFVNIRDNAGNERGLNIDANGAAAVTNSAGEAHIGEVGGKTVIKTITMTATTSILAAADIIADTQQLDAAFRVTDGTGVLQSMTVFDPDDNAAFAFDVYIHRTTTSMGTENSGISISDANAAAGIIGVVSFATTDAKDLINGRMYHKTNLGIPVSAVSGTDDLYFSVVNGSGTPTFAGGSIPIVVGILLD